MHRYHRRSPALSTRMATAMPPGLMTRRAAPHRASSSVARRIFADFCRTCAYLYLRNFHPHKRMSLLTDLSSLMAGCVALHWARSPGSFWLAGLIGLALAGACWYACSVYTHLWNRDFHMSPVHQICCAFASACTLVFVIVFSSLYY